MRLQRSLMTTGAGLALTLLLFGCGDDAAPAGAGGVGGASGAGATGGTAGSGGDGGTSGAGATGGSSGAGATGGTSGSGGDGGTGGGAAVPQDPECNANGVWIARLTTFSRDVTFSAVQTASNWYYYVMSHSGPDVTITEALDCGIQVSGSAAVTINAATTTALLTPNNQAQRHGTFVKEGDHCVFTLDRFYSVRGVPRATYLPADTSSNPALSALTPALPTKQAPAGNEDWDNNGQPGIAFNVAGLGSRHVVQRDWNEAIAHASYPVGFNATEFVVRANFDSNENILATSGGIGGLLEIASTPATNLNHRFLFRRVGLAETDAAVVALQGAADVDTCFNVQDAMPHDAAMQ